MIMCVCVCARVCARGAGEPRVCASAWRVGVHVCARALGVCLARVCVVSHERTEWSESELGQLRCFCFVARTARFRADVLLVPPLVIDAKASLHLLSQHAVCDLLPGHEFCEQILASLLPVLGIVPRRLLVRVLQLHAQAHRCRW